MEGKPIVRVPEILDAAHDLELPILGEVMPGAHRRIPADGGRETRGIGRKLVVLAVVTGPRERVAPDAAGVQVGGQGPQARSLEIPDAGAVVAPGEDLRGIGVGAVDERGMDGFEVRGAELPLAAFRWGAGAVRVVGFGDAVGGALRTTGLAPGQGDKEPCGAEKEEKRESSSVHRSGTPAQPSWLGGCHGQEPSYG